MPGAARWASPNACRRKHQTNSFHLTRTMTKSPTKRSLMGFFSRFKINRPTADRPLVELEIVDLIKTLFKAAAQRDTNRVVSMSASDGPFTLFKDDSIRTRRLSDFLEELQDEPCHYRLLVPDIRLLVHLTQAMALVPYEAIFDNGSAYFGSMSFIFMKRSGKWIISSVTQIRSSTIIGNSDALR
jgi:hypothetical protein